jgi:hypothetical protein
MKRVIWAVTFLAVLGMAGTASAWKKPAFQSVDKNHDGVIVFEEIIVFNPKLTVVIFGTIDRNKDGKIDPAEYAAMGGRSAKGTGAVKKAWWRCSGKEGMTLYMQGTDALMAGKNTEAAALLNQAVTKNLCVDYLSYAYYNLGIACMRLGDDPCARKNLEEARALNINNVVPENDFGLSGTPRKGGKQ